MYLFLYHNKNMVNVVINYSSSVFTVSTGHALDFSTQATYKTHHLSLHSCFCLYLPVKYCKPDKSCLN